MDSCLWSESFSCPSSRRRSCAVPRLSCVSLRLSSSRSLSVSMFTIKDSRLPVLPPSYPPPMPPIPPPMPLPPPAGEDGPPPPPPRPSSEIVGITSHIILRPGCVGVGYVIVCVCVKHLRLLLKCISMYSCKDDALSKQKVFL